MYRIAVLADQDEARKGYAEQIARFCQKKGLFPQIEGCSNQEQFFENVQKTAPTNAVIALPGVAGLNAVEHLRSVCPACADHLVQRSGLFVAGVSASGGILYPGARKRGELSAGPERLVCKQRILRKRPNHK